MRVLVTGGAGFIGSHVVDAMVDAGHEVLAVDNLRTGKRENVNPRAAFEQLDLVRDDLEPLVRRFRPEIVDHHAAQVSVPGGVADPVEDAMLNIIGSLRLLEAARASGVRKVVYAASGGSTYGAPEYVPVDEGHRIDPISPYAVSKHTVEHYLRTYQNLYGLQFTSLRYANVYGPRQDPHGEAGVVAIFARKMLKGETPTIFGTGQDERDYVYVTDIARANALAVDRADGKMVNIGTGVGTSTRRIFDELKMLTEFDDEPVYGPPRPGDVPSMRLDPSKARAALDWQAQVAVTDGLRRTIEWFLQREG